MAKKTYAEPIVVTDEEREQILANKKTHVFYDDWCDWFDDLPDDAVVDLAKGIASAYRGEDYTATSPLAIVLLKNARRLINENREAYVQATAAKIRGAKDRFNKDEDNISMDNHGSPSISMDNHSISMDNHSMSMDKQGVYVNVSDSVNVNENVNENVDVNDNVLPSEGTKKEDTIVSKKEPKHKYGMYNNVLLTDTEFEKLKEEFPRDWNERIDRLSEYIESKGAKYKSHLATIRAWARKDKDKAKEKKRTPFSVIDDMDFSEPLDSVYSVMKRGVGL